MTPPTTVFFIRRVTCREFIPRCYVLSAFYSWLVEFRVYPLSSELWSSSYTLAHRTPMCACRNGERFLCCAKLSPIQFQLYLEVCLTYKSSHYFLSNTSHTHIGWVIFLIFPWPQAFFFKLKKYFLNIKCFYIPIWLISVYYFQVRSLQQWLNWHCVCHLICKKVNS